MGRWCLPRESARRQYMSLLALAKTSSFVGMVGRTLLPRVRTVCIPLPLLEGAGGRADQVDVDALVLEGAGDAGADGAGAEGFPELPFGLARAGVEARADFLDPALCGCCRKREIDQ